MGIKLRSRVKVSVSAGEECKQKVLNRSNVIAAEKYNSEERILLEFQMSLKVGRWRSVNDQGVTRHERHLQNFLRFDFCGLVRNKPRRRR